MSARRWRTVAAVGGAALGAVLVLALGAVKLRYGGGRPFPDVSTAPVVSPADVQAIELELPPGCITVSSTGRVFFDTHPFTAPERFERPHVFELVDGVPRPWPSRAAQDLFVAPFGMTADRQGRLWVTEPATLDRSATRLLVFDLSTDELLFEQRLPDGEARFAQDLRVHPDGTSVVLADTGAFDFTPGQLVVFDVSTRRIVRTFRHDSLNPGPWFIRRFDGAKHAIGWGLLTFQVGVDGIEFSADGDWLYYATMSHDTLYRVPSALLVDPSVDDATVAAAIEVVGPKPQSDGITLTPAGDVLITDVENGGIARLRDGELTTLTKSADVVWADGVAVGPTGDVWFTDSAIPAYLQPTMWPPSWDALQAAGPFHLYRFRP